MVELFDIDNGVLIPTTHALMIEPFKSIWNNDTDNDKINALNAFKYIELMTSLAKSNPYSGYDIDEKKYKVAEQIYGNKDYEVDDLIKDGIRVIENFNNEASESMSFYLALKKSVEELKSFLNNVDLNERTNAGSSVYKPADITNAGKQSVELLSNLTALKKKAQSELYETSKTRNNRDVGLFER